MSRRFTLVPLALASLLAAAAARPALAGPPWISIELPASPFGAETRGAFLLVRTYHHFTAVQLVMSGTAEGLVDGRRRSIPLEIASTSTTGLFTLRKQWPNEGVWVLKITADQANAAATALVGVGSSGEVTMVRVPLSVTGGPRPVSDPEVGVLLRSLAAGRAPSPMAAGLAGDLVGRVPLWLLGAGGVLAAFPLGFGLGRRRRRAP